MRFSTENEKIINVELVNAGNFVLVKLDGINVIQIDKEGVYICDDSQKMGKYGFPMDHGLIRVRSLMGTLRNNY